MLDEVMEVESYLKDPRSDNPRIQPKLLTDDPDKGCKLNGIKDILALVTSYYLYRFAMDIEDTERMKSKATLIMRIWCGFDEDVSQEELSLARADDAAWFTQYPDADGWLKKYYEKHLAHRKSTWSDYSKEWKEKLKSPLVYSAERQCYEIILAQALAIGAPKRYYLQMKECKKGVIPGVTRSNGTLPDKRKRRNLFKIIIAYKLLQRFHPNQEWVLLQTNRVLSWMGMESDKADRWCLDIQWNGEPLVETQSVIDYKKLRVNSNFLKEMDIQLLEQLPSTVPDGYQIYCDTGYGKDNELKTY